MPDESQNGERKDSGKSMPDDQLLSLIKQYEMASLGSQVAAGATVSTTIYPSNQALTTLELDRYNALNSYLARPMGNEIENRSQVVLPVLRDTIEWMMPQLMRMFVGTKTICRFDAESQDDVKQAELETLAVNHVFMNQNNGILILHDFFKDALLMRNGYVEVYTKEEKFVAEERYKELSAQQLTELLQESADEKIKVLGHKEYMAQIESPQGPQPMQVFDIHIRRSGTQRSVDVQCIPPEEMRVTPTARQGMEDLRYSAHITTKTRSDLIADGHDKAVVDTISASRPNWLEMDALARNVVVDQLSIENPSDRSMQEIELRKNILKVDCDGDGIAELRRILIAGDKIIENEVIEETPFVSGAPMRMPHRHTGMSLYDLVMDLQIISTDLWRQGLDNLKQANNTRVAVDWRAVNFDDLLTSRPGGPIRGNGPPANWIQPIQMPSNLVEQVIPALQYIDQMKQGRTGVGKGSMGADPDELQDVTKGAYLASQSVATLILDLIARMLAEGVKGIFLKIHGELMRNQDKPLEFEVTKDNWQKVDPSQWRRRTKISPNVGLGSGNREEMRQNAMMLAQAMTGVAQMGLINPTKAFEGFRYFCESIGINNPERFALDPSTQEYQKWAQQQKQNAPQDPAIQVATIKAKATEMQEQQETQRTQMKSAVDLKIAGEKHIGDHMQQHLDRQQQAHDASRDRMIDLTQQHQDLVNNLIKIFGTIEASKAKAGQDITGQMVGADIDQAAGAIEHNQTLVENDQSHQHALQQQSQQGEIQTEQQKQPEPKKPKRRSGRMQKEADGSYSFEMTDE